MTATRYVIYNAVEQDLFWDGGGWAPEEEALLYDQKDDSLRPPDGIWAEIIVEIIPVTRASDLFGRG
jgi:hypothetical protein